MVGVEPIVTVSDIQKAMDDLKKAMRLSYAQNGRITAYEIDGTAKTIICAVNQLVARRKCGDRDG
jgi:hypothetical protein